MESLIKPEDIEEIESFKNETSPEPIHVKYVIDKVEKTQEKNQLKREPFKPYKTSKSNVHDPEKEKERKYTKHWEITAATPPHIVHGAIKPLSLNESLQLQREHVKKLQVTRQIILYINQILFYNIYIYVYYIVLIGDASKTRSRTINGTTRFT